MFTSTFNPLRDFTKMLDTIEDQATKSLEYVPAEMRTVVAGFQKAYFYVARSQTALVEQGLESLQKVFTKQ